MGDVTVLMTAASAAAFASAALAVVRPSMWAMLAAGVLNAGAVIIWWPVLFGAS